MKETTKAWLDKAERSFNFAEQLTEPPFSPYYAGVCLHSQFGTEQYLNACLREADVPFLEVKELPELLEDLIAIDPGWNCMKSLVELLIPMESEFGGFGYPGVYTNQATAIQSLQSCEQVRGIVRSHLTQSQFTLDNLHLK